MPGFTSWVPLAVLLCLCPLSSAVELNIMLPMRDGVKLNTIIDTPLWVNHSVDVVMDRSPYSIWALDVVADIFLLLENYVAVRQSLRGTQLSEGVFDLWASAGNDSYDTSLWIHNQSWSNHRLLSVGGSADGIAELFDVIAEPHTPKDLKAMFAIFAAGDARQVTFPGGAFQKALVTLWLNSTVPKFAMNLIQELKDHEEPTSWWESRTIKGRTGRVTWPAVFWGGWYDIFLSGSLLTYKEFQKDSQTRGQHRLVIDPLGHCQSASRYFPDDLIAGRVLLPIFLAIDLFKGTNVVPESVKNVTFYVMGPAEPNARGNHWTTLVTFPEFTPVNYYLLPNRLLSTNPPSAATNAASYTFDPSNPVPTIGGNNLQLPCGPLDQRPVEEGNRTDVLTFTTAPLTSDLWVTGPLRAVLYISSSAVDTDFTVKITDVYSDGTSRLIQDGITRARWACLEQENPCMKPQLLTPGNVYEVPVTILNTSYVFNQGHSIRVSISSSNYPRFDVNPNNGYPVNTTSGPLITAKNSIYMSEQYPSSIILPVIQPDQVPPVWILDSLVSEVNRRGKGHILDKYRNKK